MKILVFGITGMLGHKIWEVLNAEFPEQVFGTLRKSKSDVSEIPMFKNPHIFENLDIENSKHVLEVMNSLKPDVVINCTGVTLRKEENNNISKSMQVNSFFPHLLAMWANNNNTRLIHFSTDCVFDGTSGNYRETDYPTAKDTYGVCKFLGEVSGPNALTLRVSIIGREIFDKSELVEWFLSQKNRKVSGYSNVIYTGLTTTVLSKEVVRIIKQFPKLSGLYHVASEKISKFELLKLLNEYFRNNTQIESDSSIISDKSLNCDRYMSATGFIKPKWPEMIQHLTLE